MSRADLSAVSVPISSRPLNGLAHCQALDIPCNAEILQKSYIFTHFICIHGAASDESYHRVCKNASYTYIIARTYNECSTFEYAFTCTSQPYAHTACMHWLHACFVSLFDNMHPTHLHTPYLPALPRSKKPPLQYTHAHAQAYQQLKHIIS